MLDFFSAEFPSCARTATPFGRGTRARGEFCRKKEVDRLRLDNWREFFLDEFLDFGYDLGEVEFGCV